MVMKRIGFKMLTLAVVALMLAACGHHSQEADQMMEAAYQSKNYDRLLTLADSLETAGSLSQAKACYWRGYAFDRLKQQEKAEQQWRKAMALTEQSGGDDDVAVYVKSASRLANLLTIKGDYKGTLQMAVPATERLSELKCDTTSDYVNLLIYVGCCQAALGDSKEASDNTFRLALRKHLENIKRNHSDASYKDAIAGLINVAYYCVKVERYEEALLYTSNFCDLLAEYEQHPDVDADYIDKQVGRYTIYKAQALEGIGQKEEAAQTYAAFLETRFSKTPEGLRLAEEYIKFKERL